MTREERIRAAIAGRETDRVPVAAWMHLSEHDQDPISLAEAEVELTEKYDAFRAVLYPGFWQSGKDLL